MSSNESKNSKVNWVFSYGASGCDITRELLLAEGSIHADEIYQTSDGSFKYVFIHLKTKVCGKTIDKLMDNLKQNHNIIKQEIFGYEPVSSSSVREERLIEQEPAFQIIVKHEQEGHPNFGKWTEAGGALRGYTYLKRQLTECAQGGPSDNGQASGGSDERDPDGRSNGKRRALNPSQPSGNQGSMDLNINDLFGFMKTSVTGQFDERDKRAAVEAELHAERLKWKDMEITLLKTTMATKIAESVQAALNDMAAIHKAQLAAKDAEIKAKDDQIAEKDEETNARLFDKDEQLAEKDAEMKTKDEQLAVKDAEMKTKDEQLAVKDAEMKTKDEQLAVKDTDIKAKEEQLRVKDSKIKAKDVQLAVKDAQLAAKDTMIKAKDEQLAATDAEIKAKDEQLAVKDAEINAKDEQRAVKDAEIKAKDDQIAEKDEETKGKLLEKDASIQAIVDAAVRVERIQAAVRKVGYKKKYSAVVDIVCDYEKTLLFYNKRGTGMGSRRMEFTFTYLGNHADWSKFKICHTSGTSAFVGVVHEALKDGVHYCVMKLNQGDRIKDVELGLLALNQTLTMGSLIRTSNEERHKEIAAIVEEAIQLGTVRTYHAASLPNVVPVVAPGPAAAAVSVIAPQAPAALPVRHA